MAVAEHTLLGYELPFPREDLYVAIIAVASFLPAVVVLNFVVTRALALLGRATPRPRPSSKAA